jgi:hypothetical protein
MSRNLFFLLGFDRFHSAHVHSAPWRAARLHSLRILCVAAVWLLALPAWAKIDGIASTSCSGCHSSSAATVTLSAQSATIDPGELVRLTIAITGSNTNGGGFYISSGAEGAFSVVAGQGTKLNGSGVSHSARKADVGGTVTFQVDWTAPDTPGVTRFSVGAVSANADGSRSGDQTGTDTLDIVYGCDPITVYRDYDQDGYGTDLITSLDCAASAAWAVVDNDCNESNAEINPGAEEVCNLVDDNCDTQIDEGLQNVTVYLDEDGDGHGVPDQTALGCGANPGYASVDDDCDDSDELAYPGAAELCNERDDDCDGDEDEGLRIICGIGICRRTAESCFASECIPGIPEVEQCNGLDDDCDVYVDEDSCPIGQICTNAQCVDDPSYVPAVDGGVSAGGQSSLDAGSSAGTGGMTSVDPMTPAGGVAGTAGVTNEGGESGGIADDAGVAGAAGATAGTLGVLPGSTASSGGGCTVHGASHSSWQVWCFAGLLLIAGWRRRALSKGRGARE